MLVLSISAQRISYVAVSENQSDLFDINNVIW